MYLRRNALIRDMSAFHWPEQYPSMAILIAREAEEESL